MGARKLNSFSFSLLYRTFTFGHIFKGIAHKFAQSQRLNFMQLIIGQYAVIINPEDVTTFQSNELFANDAARSGADLSAVHVFLHQQTSIQINIVFVRIQVLHRIPTRQHSWLAIVESAELDMTSTEGFYFFVAADTMITASLMINKIRIMAESEFAHR